MLADEVSCLADEVFLRFQLLQYMKARLRVSGLGLRIGVEGVIVAGGRHGLYISCPCRCRAAALRSLFGGLGFRL